MDIDPDRAALRRAPDVALDDLPHLAKGRVAGSNPDFRSPTSALEG
jgi:hypothetical protein